MLYTKISISTGGRLKFGLTDYSGYAGSFVSKGLFIKYVYLPWWEWSQFGNREQGNDRKNSLTFSYSSQSIHHELPLIFLVNNLLAMVGEFTQKTRQTTLKTFPLIAEANTLRELSSNHNI